MTDAKNSTTLYQATTNDFPVRTIQNLKSTGTNLSKFDYTYDSDGQIATQRGPYHALASSADA